MAVREPVKGDDCQAECLKDGAFDPSPIQSYLYP